MAKPSYSLIGGGEDEPRRLELRLESSDDRRFVTSVGLYDRDVDRADLLALEIGSLDAAWPPSPPIQECQPHDSLPTTLLATGMASKSYWATVFEAHHQPPRLVWDVACRVKNSPEFLGIHICIQPPVRAQILNPTTAELRIGSGEPVFLHAELAILTLKDQTLKVEAPCPTGKLPATIRWKMTITTEH